MAETSDLQLVHRITSRGKKMEVQLLQKKQSAGTGVYTLAPREKTDKPQVLQRMYCDKGEREA